MISCPRYLFPCLYIRFSCFFEVRTTKPAFGGGTISLGEDVIEGGGVLFKDVDPGSDGGGDKLEEVEGCSEVEMGWDSETPGAIAVRETAQALRTCISTVGDGWTTIGTKVHVYSFVCIFNKQFE